MKIKLAHAAVVALTTAIVSFPQSAVAGSESVCLDAKGTLRATWVTGAKYDWDHYTQSPITRYNFSHSSRQGKSSVSGNPVGKTHLRVHSWVDAPTGKTTYHVIAYCNQ